MYRAKYNPVNVLPARAAQLLEEKLEGVIGKKHPIYAARETIDDPDADECFTQIGFRSQRTFWHNRAAPYYLTGLLKQGATTKQLVLGIHLDENTKRRNAQPDDYFTLRQETMRAVIAAAKEMSKERGITQLIVHPAGDIAYAALKLYRSLGLQINTYWDPVDGQTYGELSTLIEPAGNTILKQP
jgi:hypothetical protein